MVNESANLPHKFQDDIHFLRESLRIIEASCGIVAKINHATILFLYLLDHPAIMEEYPVFREVVRKKVGECIVESENAKAESVLTHEGGKFNQAKFEAAESLQRVSRHLQELIASL